MDFGTIAASAATAILGIGAVSAFFSKNIPKIIKYVVLAKDAITILDEVLEVLQDGKLTPEEIEQLKKDIEQLKADLK